MQLNVTGRDVGKKERLTGSQTKVWKKPGEDEIGQIWRGCGRAPKAWVRGVDSIL